MKRLILILAFLFASTLGVFAEGGRFALVIGNADYESLPVLRNPARDAEAVANQLSHLGFTAYLTQDVSRTEMERAFSIFQEKAAFAETVVFYFAGHAASIGPENFLFSSQFEPNSEAGVNESIALRQILEEFLPNAPTRLVFLDACQEALEIETPNERIKAQAISPDFPPLNTLIATASAPGTSAHDGVGRHSLFTGALLDNLSAPNLDVELMLRMTARDTMINSQGIQRPQTQSNLTDRFFFNRDPNLPLQSLPSAADRPLTHSGYAQKSILHSIANGIVAPETQDNSTPEMAKLIAHLCGKLDSDKPEICL